MTPIQIFGLIVLPIAVASGGWIIALTVNRRLGSEAFGPPAAREAYRFRNGIDGKPGTDLSKEAVSKWGSWSRSLEHDVSLHRVSEHRPSGLVDAAV